MNTIPTPGEHAIEAALEQLSRDDMQLTLHDSYRAWKGFDWETLDRLYEKGWIENPRSKAKSVVLTEEGLANSAHLFQLYFDESNETQ